MEKPGIIAEIGCNHKGDLKIALEMIKTAKLFCDVDVVKFQKRTPKKLLSENDYSRPHPNQLNSYGATYGEHREFLEFDIKQHKILKDYCEELNVIYSTSVWDTQSALEIIDLNPQFIKVPSACNMNKELLKILCEKFEGKIHLSLGMTTHDEEDLIHDLFMNYGRNKDLIFYSCTSGYPVDAKDVCLNEITRLISKFNDSVDSIAFSGHHLGIALDIGAYVLGAKWIERHFTINRTWKGTDHAASLEPSGLRKLVRDLGALSEGLANKKSEILDIEIVQRDKLKKGQIKWKD